MRNIKTKYYVGKRYAAPIQTNSATDANMAVAQSVLRMQIGYYTDANGNALRVAPLQDRFKSATNAIRRNMRFVWLKGQSWANRVND
jgi:ADP-ribosylglycohydrolase